MVHGDQPEVEDIETDDMVERISGSIVFTQGWATYLKETRNKPMTVAAALYSGAFMSMAIKISVVKYLLSKCKKSLLRKLLQNIGVSNNVLVLLG